VSGHLSVRLTHHDPGSNVRVEVGDDGAVWLWLAIADDVWVEVRAPRAVPVPETERVPWWEAVGRVVPDVGTIREVGMSGDQAWVRCGDYDPDGVAPDGTVEVLRRDGEQ
jgi:hypothetical protein